MWNTWFAPPCECFFYYQKSGILGTVMTVT